MTIHKESLRVVVRSLYVKWSSLQGTKWPNKPQESGLLDILFSSSSTDEDSHVYQSTGGSHPSVQGCRFRVCIIDSGADSHRSSAISQQFPNQQQVFYTHAIKPVVGYKHTVVITKFIYTASQVHQTCYPLPSGIPLL